MYKEWETGKILIYLFPSPSHIFILLKKFCRKEKVGHETRLAINESLKRSLELFLSHCYSLQLADLVAVWRITTEIPLFSLEYWISEFSAVLWLSLALLPFSSQRGGDLRVWKITRREWTVIKLCHRHAVDNLVYLLCKTR